MELIIQSNNLNDYLGCSEVIGCNNIEIQEIARNLIQGAENEIGLVKSAYEFVRDEIRHSSDAGKNTVTWKASDVLRYKHGLCFANSHLLAAILRFLKIPTGFCYQKLEFDEGYGLHGLNAVFISNLNKWIRLDARGNENGINAQFRLDKEILAYSVNEEKGEVDFPTIYSEPNKKVIEILKTSKNLTEAMNKVINTEWLYLLEI
ncbi:transglutaminase-like domain-containing protein [Methanobacterium oryzae]|uniref:transglutaminase-like domain-containing protein n=1 Tax=Methanobacterium oryzae TaxID=69540 RepID=UPI003D19BE94